MAAEFRLVTNEEAEKQLNVIRAHASRLRDSGFTHVQIFAAKFEEKDGTRHFSYGEGDYLGRYGHVSIWLERSKSEEWQSGEKP